MEDVLKKYCEEAAEKYYQGESAAEHLRRHPSEALYKLATEYIDTLERDKRIVAARYVARFRENPSGGRDMGFVQFVESKLNTEQNGS